MLLQPKNEEQMHADWVAQRITQLGGTPNFDPEGLATRAHAEYREGDTLEEMIEEDLVAERVAIETYSKIVRWLGNDDPTTRRMQLSGNGHHCMVGKVEAEAIRSRI